MNALIIYLLVALSIGLTSYLTIYRPSIELYEEVSEDFSSVQRGIIFQLFWILLATALAPIIGMILLKGKNTKYIKNLALYWIGEDVE